MSGPKDKPYTTPDPVALAQALRHVYERALPAIQQFWTKAEQDMAGHPVGLQKMGEIYGEFLEKLSQDPEKFWDMQAAYWGEWAKLWQESARKLMGEEAQAVIQPAAGDRRFRNEVWQENAVFDFIKQSYLLTCRWMDESVRRMEGLDGDKKDRLAFYNRLFTDALAPTNFALTNPDVIEETLRTGGENLVKGLENLVGDLERGNGSLKISTTDYNAFTLGGNIAVTPGSVIYQNDLMQLIQYEPSTEKVFKRPLLIVPPWINKYYILDLKPENSFIKWAVSQGHTVFVVSWVNPDGALAEKRFEDYMREGILEPLSVIRKITGQPDCNVIGYCLGGTLLTITLAWLAAKDRAHEIASATCLTTLIDFSDAGELKLFTGEDQLAAMDKDMSEKGVLEAKNLQRTFSLLRANDLIWSFVINNYLMGKEPFPFDLLYWNDDSTNMPAAMHGFYLRAMYRDNLLTKAGGIAMFGTPIDVRSIKTPAYFLSAREDHIAPWKATYAGAKLYQGDVRFTLAASGHIAGVINPPGKQKYAYWTGGDTEATPDEWLKHAKQTDGSWWPHWQSWIAAFGNGETTSRPVENALEPAPGRYAQVKSG